MQDNYINSNGLLYLIQRIKTVLADKVDKQTGYSLIADTEILRLSQLVNYDDTEVQNTLTTLAGKVDALEKGAYDDTELRTAITEIQEDLEALAGANANVIEIIKVNGTALTPDATKAVDITIPTKVSDLTNDANYLTAVPDEYITSDDIASDYLTKVTAANTYATLNDTYNKTEIDNRLKGGVHAKGSVATYADLPLDAQHGDMYNIIAADADHGIKAGDNVVYIIDDEDIGTWDNYGGIIDTSSLVAKSDAMTNEQIEQIWTEIMG